MIQGKNIAELNAKLLAQSELNRITCLGNREFYEAFIQLISNISVEQTFAQSRELCQKLFGLEAGKQLAETTFISLINNLALSWSYAANTLLLKSIPLGKAESTAELEENIKNPDDLKLLQLLTKNYPTEKFPEVLRLMRCYENVFFISGQFREAFNLSLVINIVLDDLLKLYGELHNDAKTEHQKQLAKHSFPPPNSPAFDNMPGEKKPMARLHSKILKDFEAKIKSIGILITELSSIKANGKKDRSKILNFLAYKKQPALVLEYYRLASMQGENQCAAIVYKLLSGNFIFTAEEFHLLYEGEPDSTLREAITLLMLGGEKDKVQAITSQLYVDCTVYFGGCIDTIAYIFKQGTGEELQALILDFRINHRLIVDAYLSLVSDYKNNKNLCLAVRARRIWDSIRIDDSESTYNSKLEYGFPSPQQRIAPALQPQRINLNEPDETIIKILIDPCLGIITPATTNKVFGAGTFHIQNRFAISTSAFLSENPVIFQPSEFLDNLSISPHDVRISRAERLSIINLDQMPDVRYVLNELFRFREAKMNLIINEINFSTMELQTLDSAQQEILNSLCQVVFANQIILYLKRAYNIDLNISEIELENQNRHLLALLPQSEKWHPETREYFNSLRYFSGPFLSQRVQRNKP